MGISIAITTYNRAVELERTLVSLQAIDSDENDEYEVLVINNNSTDDTAEVVASMASQFGGRLRHIFEATQGLSHARNRAIGEARFSVVAFLDDDVNVDRRWLRQMSSAFASGVFAAVGGRAHLVFPLPRPAWLGARDEGLLTKVELGLSRRPAEPGEIYGLNLGFRKEWVMQVGGFRTDLGRVGSCLLSGEESELLGRIVAAGGRLLYEPDAVVGHRVPPARLRRRWFWSRCYWGQRGEMRMLAESEVTPYEALRRLWHVVLALKVCAKTLLTTKFWGEEAFHQTRVMAERLGECVGILHRLAKKPRVRHLRTAESQTRKLRPSESPP